MTMGLFFYVFLRSFQLPDFYALNYQFRPENTDLAQNGLFSQGGAFTFVNWTLKKHFREG